jgi:cell division protein FtsI (penicillin-binding protein 3)
VLTRQSINRNGKVLIAVIALFWVIFIGRAVHIQIIHSAEFRDYADSQHRSTMPLAARRGAIFDCKGHPLAYDIEAKSYAVNPKYMKRPSDAASKLARITGKSKAYWMTQFAKRPGFLMVARRVSQEMAYDFDDSGIETLKSRSESMRIYPYGELAIEVIGRTDADNRGISGLESYYDSLLAGIDGQSIYLRDAYGREVTSWEHTLLPPLDGSDIYLALDVNLQEIVESELQAMLDSCRALWGTAIFLDARTGGVLASATVESDKSLFRRCRPIVDMNEPGSTAKLIPLAAVFQERIFEPDDIVNVEHGRFTVSGKVIRDDHPHDLLRCYEIGVYSSNIGAAKLGLAAGADLIYRTLVQFGFGTRTGIDFPGESSGILYKPEKWTKHNLASICFGYGVMASALQIASAYSVIASGGELHKPFFATNVVSPDSMEKTLNEKTIVRRILSQRTISILDGIFKDVVRLGTAKKASDEMCPIAGKTGTALRTRLEGKGYDSGKALASFTGYFPADDPKVVGIVMFDEPKSGIYGGDISAPVFKNIARRYSMMPGSRMLVNSRPQPPDDSRVLAANSGGTAKVMKLAERRPLRQTGVAKKRASGGGFPDFTGQTIRDALRQAKEMGLTCRITGSGTVVAQVPPPCLDTTGVELIELIGEEQ